MPGFRTIRRSRRISHQPPRDPNTDEYDLYDLHLMYPDSDPESAPSPTATTSHDAAPYSPGDDAGEPEVDPDSLHPPSSSNCSVPAQRSSHSRKRDPNYVPRPRNAFMFFRSAYWLAERSKATAERDHRQISRMAGQRWHELSPAQRAPFYAKAEEDKRLHALAHPDYKYTPVYRKDRGMKRKTKPSHSDKGGRGCPSDNVKKELEQRAAASDDYSSDSSDEYVEGPRRKKARRSSGKKPAAPPRSRNPRLAKGEITSEQNDERDVTTSPALAAIPVKTEPSPATQPQLMQQSVSPTLHDEPPSSSSAEGDGFVATADIPEFSLGEPAYGCEIQFTDPFSPDFTRSPESPFSSHDPLSPAPGCPSLSDDFLDFPAESNNQELSSPDNAFIGIFDVKPTPLMSPFEPFGSYGFEPPSTFYACDTSPDQLTADPEFSDWMRYDSCA